MNFHDATGRLQSFLLLLLVLGIVSALTELVLLEHWDETWQLVPFGVLGLGLITAIGFVLKPRKWTARILQIAMVSFVVTGCLGLTRHYRGNELFALELRPSLSGLDLIRETVMGATPLLAPGLLAYMGLLGLAITYRHPLLGKTSEDERRRKGASP